MNGKESYSSINLTGATCLENTYCSGTIASSNGKVTEAKLGIL